MLKAVFLVLFISCVLAQSCSTIYTVGNQRYQTPLVAPSLLPVFSGTLPPTACDNSSTAEGPCSYEEHFSCIKFDFSTQSFTPFDCKTAFNQQTGPLCTGQAQFKADCNTFDCCQELNHAALPWVLNNTYFYQITSIQYYYWMEFQSQGGTPISCQSFSDGYDTCVQNLNFFEDSSPINCRYIYENFVIKSAGSADEMAFNLF